MKLPFNLMKLRLFYMISSLETEPKTSETSRKTIHILNGLWAVILPFVPRLLAIFIVTAANLFIPGFYAKVNQENFNIYLKDSLPRHISKYWAHLYGDTALDGTQAAYACGYAFFGPNRMMYGTDYPFGAEAGEDFVRSNLMGVKSMDIPLNEVSKILGLNAKEILKIT